MKKPISNRTNAVESPLREREGFALIITISLMAFLVLLLVTLTTLTKVETQIASNSQRAEVAKANARMALNIAIGQLQEHAGPDNRVTARSDINVNTPATFWTGVWNASSTGGAPLTWLVSGNEGSNSLLHQPVFSRPAPGSDHVRLVGENTARPNPSYATMAGMTGSQADWDVLVPRIPITISDYPGRAGGNHTVGHYGWAVLDQGIKASVALTDRSREAVNYSTDEQGHLRKLAAQRFRGEVFFQEFFPDQLNFTKPALEQVVQYNQLNFTRDGHSRISDYFGQAGLLTKFHDATHMNFGVLSSTTGGNLQNRNDLSQGAGTQALNEYLRSFSRPGVQINADSSRFPIVSPPADVPSGEAVFSIAPVISEFGFRLGVSDLNGQLAVHYRVELELWNPYTSTLQGEVLQLYLASLPKISVANADNPVPIVIDLSEIFDGVSVLPESAPLWQAGWRPGEVAGVSTGNRTIPTGIPFARSEEAPDPNIRVAVVEDQQEGSFSFELELRRATTPSGQNPRLVRLTTVDFVPFQLPPYPRQSPELRMGYVFHYRDGGHFPNWLAAIDPRTPVMGSQAFAQAYSTLTHPARGGMTAFDSRPQELLRSTTAEPAFVPLFELPRQEAVSIGSLQHVLFPGSRAYHFGNTEGNGLDDYFLSTVPQNWNGRSPLPNSRMTLYGSGTQGLFSPTGAADRLLVKGIFNINSTSPEAWASLLGSIWIPEWSLANAFFRYSHTAHHQGLRMSPTAVTDFYRQGVRTLDVGNSSRFVASPAGASERDRLALRIVAGIRARGPFPSLEQFVESGVIQEAIDGVPTINQGIPPHSPAFLSQADILTAIAPFIAPRSDTFLVRAYGDAFNPVTGRVQGRAYCEAVVQRVPAPHGDPRFGRQFEIVSFRWLDPNEI